MKTIFTSLCVCICTLFISQVVFSQCNYASGSNGISIAFTSAITIDGNMADWVPYLNDPDNNSYDNTASVDLDAPISDAGRDLSRFTFTENANNLFIYLQRAGSVNNSVDIIFYADINNNGLMELNEPVIHIDWSGATGNVSVDSYNYIPSATGLLNSITANLDGSSLWGTLHDRNNIGQTGKGSADGKSVEIRIPFAQLTQLNATGNVINQLSFGQDFKYHISSINGSVASIPNQNSINDNFGGCLHAPSFILPIKLLSFTAMLINNTNKVDLKWVTASEMNASHFVIEKSTDGNTFSDAGMVFAFGNTDEQKNYLYTDNIGSMNITVIYYRLRMVDIDGHFEYSATRIIRISKQDENTLTLLTYPNPVISEIRITIPGKWQGKKVTYKIVNANGLLSEDSQVGSSVQTETLNVSTLARGVYIIKASCGDQSAWQKIIKQ